MMEKKFGTHNMSQEFKDNLLFLHAVFLFYVNENCTT